jgi:hypothetical protein
MADPISFPLWETLAVTFAKDLLTIQIGMATTGLTMTALKSTLSLQR